MAGVRQEEMEAIGMQDPALCPLQRKATLVKEKERKMETEVRKKMETNLQTDQSSTKKATSTL